MELEVIIDFDDALRCWRSNKKSIGNGSFVYTCEYIHKNGNKCNNNIIDNTIMCKQHIKQLNKK